LQIGPGAAALQVWRLSSQRYRRELNDLFCALVCGWRCGVQSRLNLSKAATLSSYELANIHNAAANDICKCSMAR
jgi:hypothetical protein